MSNVNLLAKVYQCHPSVVGLPTTRHELYNPPPLTRAQVIPFSVAWGVPLSHMPTEWGTVISPILVAMHLQVEGRRPKVEHTDAIVQYTLWVGGDAVCMFHRHIARALPAVVPRRTMFWYLDKYGLRVRDLQKVGMLYQDARGRYVWAVSEVRDALREVDTLVLEWYRLAYLSAR